MIKYHYRHTLNGLCAVFLQYIYSNHCLNCIYTSFEYRLNMGDGIMI